MGTPGEFQRLVQDSWSQDVADTREVIVVRGIRCVRGFSGGLNPQQVTLYGCWGNRDGLEAPRSFAFKQHSDVRADEIAQVPSRRVRGFQEHPDDVFAVSRHKCVTDSCNNRNCR